MGLWKSENEYFKRDNEDDVCDAAIGNENVDSDVEVERGVICLDEDVEEKDADGHDGYSWPVVQP